MKKIIVAAAAILTLALSGCAGMYSTGPRHYRSSTLVEYLYGREPPPVEVEIPELQLPLTVGLAFLPQAGGQVAIDEVEKSAILERIRERFGSRPFVRDIVEIPGYYLSQNPGTSGLAALQRLYNMDLLALVSYDQVSHQDDNPLSLTYLSIVGGVIFPGTNQDVTTVLDMAVIHPSSRSLVLRAAGMDNREGVTTALNAEPRLRERRTSGFHAASDQMIERFDAELTRFEQQVRSGTARVKVQGGGGSFDWPALALLTLLAGGAWMSRRQEPARR
ncbi:MAG TPA: rhombotarget lipoprotein [Steroidobacteraceae bacterium]|nr:rhombotarget lipoprotein [Steroidobacteraceae bacterium]